MDMTELQSYIQARLSDLIIEDGKELDTYRDCRDLIIECHTLLNEEMLNRDTIEQFVLPIRQFIWNIADKISGGDNHTKLRRIAQWQRTRDSQVNKYFVEKIKAIAGVTGYETDKEFIYYAKKAFFTSQDENAQLKDLNKRSKHTESKSFDLDTYLQVTELLLWSDNPYEQLVGLTASLGRRPSELFNPDSFKLIEKSYFLQFEGQLKTKTDTRVSYTIPTLYEAKYIYEIWKSVLINPEIKEKLDLIYQLEENDIERNELIDDRFNHKLNKIVKEKYAFIPVPTRLEHLFPSVTCRILRHCYGTIMVSREQDTDDLSACIHYFGNIMGHDYNADTTLSYTDYKVFKYEQMKYNLEVPSFNVDLDLNNRKKLYSLMCDTGLDINDLMSKMIDCYEQNKPKQIAFSSQSWYELKGNSAPNSGNEKVLRAVSAIMAHNDSQGEKELKYCLTARAVMDLTGSRHSIVKRFFDDNHAMIEGHNNTHDLTPVHNRGKMSISEAIIIQ